MSESSQTPQPKSTTSADLAKTREEMLARAAKVTGDLQKQHPEADLSSGWWIPAINLAADTQERLNDETQQKLNSCLQKVFDQKYAPAALEAAREEGRKYLVGHDDILDRFEAIFQNKEGWAAMNKWAVEKSETKKPSEPTS